MGFLLGLMVGRGGCLGSLMRMTLLTTALGSLAAFSLPGVDLPKLSMPSLGVPFIDVTWPSKATVVAVTDGDTVRLRLDGKIEKVRIMGIDTPETKKPGTPVECGGRAATAALRRLALGKRVRFQADAGADHRDRYGRLLGYVDLKRGERDIGLAQIEAGHSSAYAYRGEDFGRQGDYEAAESRARRAKRGVWGACDGDFHSAR